MNQLETKTRFDALLGEWKVTQEYGQRKDLHALLDRVSTWLSTSVTEPARDLRAAQIVLTDPDRPTFSKLVRLRALPLGEGGVAVFGEREDQLIVAQAMLLAVYETGGKDEIVAPRIVSAVDALKVSPRAHDPLVSWGRAAVADDHTGDPKDLTEFLWWGHARYSRSLREPFRRITRRSPDEALWWAAYEAATKAKTLAIEPSAAYLVETLVSLGQRDDEPRALGEWMHALHKVLVVSKTPQPPLNPTFAELVTADAQALPVTWVRLQAAKNRPLDDAEHHVGLDLSAEIDRGQWASWLFRELTLDLVFPQATP